MDGAQNLLSAPGPPSANNLLSTDAGLKPRPGADIGRIQLSKSHESFSASSSHRAQRSLGTTGRQRPQTPLVPSPTEQRTSCRSCNSVGSGESCSRAGWHRGTGLAPGLGPAALFPAHAAWSPKQGAKHPTRPSQHVCSGSTGSTVGSRSIPTWGASEGGLSGPEGCARYHRSGWRPRCSSEAAWLS